MLNEELRARKIELIAKLQALAGGDPESEEAKTAAKMAGKLMARYGIQLSEVIANEPVGVREDVIHGISDDTKKWESVLSAVIAEVFDLKTVTTTYRLEQRYEIRFIGTPNDLEIGTWFYKLIRIKVGKLSEARRLLAKETYSWQEHYAYGLVCGVGDRLSELYASRKEEETSDTKALVLVKTDAVEKYYESAYPEVRASRIKAPRSSASALGFLEGQKLNLNQPVNGGGHQGRIK